MNKKAEMLRELGELEQMKSSLVKQSRVHEKNKLSMSRLDEEDKQLIKQLNKKRRKHEKEMEAKVIEF